MRARGDTRAYTRRIEVEDLDVMAECAHRLTNRMFVVARVTDRRWMQSMLHTAADLSWAVYSAIHDLKSDAIQADCEEDARQNAEDEEKRKTVANKTAKRKVRK